MRVFVTGATGFIGSAVTRELIAAGHTVLGLARNDAAVDTLARLGAEVQQGDLSNPIGLASAAQTCDGVIHTAFIHNFGDYLASVETDRVAVQAMARALEGTGKPLVIASGTALVASGQLATEHDEPGPGAFRGESEATMQAAAGRGVRTSIVRLSPSVHDAGDHGFIPMLIEVARRTGVAAFIGDGANRWPAVHRLDAAHLFRLALEKATPGARLHAVGEEGIAMRAIAETIGAGLGVPVTSLTIDEAQVHFDWMARFVAIDNPSSSALTREKLDWQPKGKGLLADMRESGYFT